MGGSAAAEEEGGRACGFKASFWIRIQSTVAVGSGRGST